MPEDAISDGAKAFIASHIDSVLQLEVLLLLQAHPGRRFTSSDLAQELRIDPGWASDQLARLSAAGVLAATADTPPAYAFEPRTKELGQAVRDLAAAYANRRVTVVEMIFSRPLDRIRSFADAFRIRREKSDG